MRTKRIALMGASLVLMGGMTAACGSGGSPTDASEKDYCAAVDKLNKAENFEDGKDAAKNLEDVGTPEKISDDAREGFEILMDAVSDLEDEDDALDADAYSDEDEKKVNAYFEYQGKTCS